MKKTMMCLWEELAEDEKAALRTKFASVHNDKPRLEPEDFVYRFEDGKFVSRHRRDCECGLRLIKFWELMGGRCNSCVDRAEREQARRSR